MGGCAGGWTVASKTSQLFHPLDAKRKHLSLPGYGWVSRWVGGPTPNPKPTEVTKATGGRVEGQPG